jgi:hypothetical protein
VAGAAVALDERPDVAMVGDVRDRAPARRAAGLGLGPGPRPGSGGRVARSARRLVARGPGRVGPPRRSRTRDEDQRDGDEQVAHRRRISPPAHACNHVCSRWRATPWGEPLGRALGTARSARDRSVAFHWPRSPPGATDPRREAFTRPIRPAWRRSRPVKSERRCDHAS